uniref:Uncharacterized protein n=1 Tax=Anopheles atroparvus TaxID=41427 RepID=A0A182IRG4_ANOAO
MEKPLYHSDLEGLSRTKDTLNHVEQENRAAAKTAVLDPSRKASGFSSLQHTSAFKLFRSGNQFDRMTFSTVGEDETANSDALYRPYSVLWMLLLLLRLLLARTCTTTVGQVVLAAAVMMSVGRKATSIRFDRLSKTERVAGLSG